MATNRTHEKATQLAFVVTHPAVPASGDPCRVGQRPGVALITEDSVDGKTTVQFDGEFRLSVKAIDGGGNSAVAVGDILYYVDADTPPLSKKNTGVRFGYASEAVTSGATAAIKVMVGY